MCRYKTNSWEDLEKRKDKAMKRSDTDDFWITIESLQLVLFVIFAIKKWKDGYYLNQKDSFFITNMPLRYSRSSGSFDCKNLV